MNLHKQTPRPPSSGDIPAGPQDRPIRQPRCGQVVILRVWALGTQDRSVHGLTTVPQSADPGPRLVVPDLRLRDTVRFCVPWSPVLAETFLTPQPPFASRAFAPLLFNRPPITKVGS